MKTRAPILLALGTCALGVAPWSCGQHDDGDRANVETEAGVTPPPTSQASATPAETATAQVGPEGASLTLPSGARLVVPSGALATLTTLQLRTLVTTSTPSGETAVGTGISAGPNGQKFLKPIDVFLPYEPARVPSGSDSSALQIFMAPSGTSDYVALQTDVDPKRHELHTTTIHFTDFIPVQNPTSVFITTLGALPDATVGQAYSATLTAVGGTSPYSWSLLPGSSLPDAITLGAQGVLSGVPNSPSSSTFFLTASDAVGHSVARAFALNVMPALNPVPTLTTIAPSTAVGGAVATNVTLTGVNFVPTSSALWDGAPLATAFVSQSSLTATIPAAALASAGTHHLTVSTPPPGGGVSASVDFIVAAPPSNPVPTIATVSPITLPTSAVDLQIDVTGTGFVASTSVEIGGQPIATVFESSTSLTAKIPASYLSAAGSLLIDVTSPPPGGGTSTSSVSVTVLDAGLNDAGTGNADASADADAPCGDFTIDSMEQVTIWQDHPWNSEAPMGSEQVFSCETGAQVLSLGNEGIDTAALPAGSYRTVIVPSIPGPNTYPVWYYTPQRVIEPLWPSALNTSAATAQDLSSGVSVTDRIVDPTRTKRFYRISTPVAGMVNVGLVVAEHGGNIGVFIVNSDPEDYGCGLMITQTTACSAAGFSPSGPKTFLIEVDADFGLRFELNAAVSAY